MFAHVQLLAECLHSWEWYGSRAIPHSPNKAHLSVQWEWLVVSLPIADSWLKHSAPPNPGDTQSAPHVYTTAPSPAPPLICLEMYLTKDQRPVVDNLFAQIQVHFTSKMGFIRSPFSHRIIHATITRVITGPLTTGWAALTDCCQRGFVYEVLSKLLDVTD